MPSKRFPLFNILAVCIIILASIPLSSPAAQGVDQTDFTEHKNDKQEADSTFQLNPVVNPKKEAEELENTPNAQYTSHRISYSGTSFQPYQDLVGTTKGYQSYGCAYIDGG